MTEADENNFETPMEKNQVLDKKEEAIGKYIRELLKIASENGIDSVQEVKIKMDSEKGSIVFKKSEETSSEDK